jgi:hypothetical protein
MIYACSLPAITERRDSSPRRERQKVFRDGFGDYARFRKIVRDAESPLKGKPDAASVHISVTFTTRKSAGSASRLLLICNFS